jgi:hypothetical protein
MNKPISRCEPSTVVEAAPGNPSGLVPGTSTVRIIQHSHDRDTRRTESVPARSKGKNLEKILLRKSHEAISKTG